MLKGVGEDNRRIATSCAGKKTGCAVTDVEAKLTELLAWQTQAQSFECDAVV